VPLWPSVVRERPTANSVSLTIGDNNICKNNNKSRQCQRDHRYELQEWKCHCGHHHTGSGQDDADSVVLAIRNDKNHKSRQCHCGHRQLSPTAPWWPSARTTYRKVPKPEEIRILVHRGGQMDRQSQRGHRSPILQQSTVSM
jgi:hypothetical protein